MSAEILQFPEPPKGNGALGVIKHYFELIHPARMCAKMLVDQQELSTVLSDEDYFLAYLYAQGFKLVPVE